MNEKEKFAQNLGEATAHWLAYRRLSGFEELFSEALLMMSVAEFLLGHGYQVTAERDTTKLGFNFGEPGEANYDIEASKDGVGKLLVEMKYLKNSQDHRIIKDFVKLALPPEEAGYDRLFLLGYLFARHRVRRQAANVGD